MHMRRAKGEPLGLPDVPGGDYLIEALFQAGPTVATPAGEAPLSWLDLWAFAQATGAVSESWEIQALRDMSRSYLHERLIGTEPLAMISPADRKPEPQEGTLL